MQYSKKQLTQIISILKRFNIPDANIAMVITNLVDCSIYSALEKVKGVK